ncbi:hypothetical protein BFG05_04610 [Campylobacter pinnipediorum subsp. pinnipediorum]|nr:hypothetical protein BFG05_04610 [Campylobacter pinnipediorum subsp. pinnipediorum]
MNQIIFTNYLNKGFMMIKKIFLASLVCSLGLASQMINGIAATVEDEPITTFEVESVKDQLKVDDKKALDILIRDRLEQVQIRALGIVASPFEINQKIESIAKQNGFTMAQFRNEIEHKQNINYNDFKNNIQKTILQEKLYKSIFADVGKNITEDTAKAYFEANKQNFSVFKNIKVMIFKSNSEDKLKKQMNAGTKAIDGVSVQTLSFDYKNINPRLASLLANTNNNSFTQILKGEKTFDMFYVLEKNGIQTPDYESMKEQVASMLYSSEQERAAYEYFEKLKAKTKVKIIRK